ncbi:MAG TPA: segregation/condensation protein A, partial [bacterium]|nr:segregation/condensation protein A [bacterium]
LLLQLIEQEKMDISQVALAKVTDQYLAYLEQTQDISATELADFLVVATKLLVIKSKTLLPQLADEEEDSAEQLEAQLKMYQDYLAATKLVEEIIGQQRFCFNRERLAVKSEVVFSPPSQLTALELAAIFTTVLNRIDYIVNLPQKIMARAVSLKEVVADIREKLRQFKKMNFQNVLVTAQSRAEVVVCFMALLELIKSGEVAVNQRGVLDDILIEKV